MTEMWCDICGYEGEYQISNLGNVRSLDRYCIDKKGRAVWHRGKVMRLQQNSRGYYRVWLRGKSRSENAFVHRLVASHFVDNPNPVELNVVNHLDFDPHNNCADNLEWTTGKGNMHYSLYAGRFRRTDEWLKKLRAYCELSGRSVIATNIETGEKRFYKCLNDCRKDGFQPSCVCCCCKGKRGVKQHKGFIWRYANDLGIETMTPAELSLLMDGWKNE